MADKHARSVNWGNGHRAHYFYDPEVNPEGSTYGNGESADDVHARIEEVKQGLRAPDVLDLESLSTAVTALHEEHRAAGVRLVEHEHKTNALAAMIEQHAELLAKGTGATLAEVHAAADAHVRTRLAKEHIEHVQRAVKLHTEEWRNEQFAKVTDELHAHRHKLTTELHAAVDAELADKRKEHADLTAKIDARKAKP